jgi:hypothetical protein
MTNRTLLTAGTQRCQCLDVADLNKDGCVGETELTMGPAGIKGGG